VRFITWNVNLEYKVALPELSVNVCMAEVQRCENSVHFKSQHCRLIFDMLLNLLGVCGYRKFCSDIKYPNRPKI